MLKPKGSVTISQAQMQDCESVEDIMDLYRARGLPLMDHPGILEPHPDYTYTEHVDYACHAITITWELNHE